MRLNVEKLNTFNAVNQLTIARTHQAYMKLNSKLQSKRTAAEVKELEALKSQLAPFDLDADLSPTVRTERADEKLAQVAEDNRGIVLNTRKVAAANLSGAQELALHRASTTMGRLIEKPAEFLTSQEKSELAKLRNELLRFVGLEGEVGKDSDFKRAAE